MEIIQQMHSRSFQGQ